MELKSFRVVNYRSVNDSSDVEVGQRTALVGRNESGKTNLLLALESLNPPEGLQKLTFVKDFPRDRRKSEFSEDLRLIETTWELTGEEQVGLLETFPRAGGVSEVTVARDYQGSRLVGFKGLGKLVVDETVVRENLGKVRRSVTSGLRGKDAAVSDRVKEILQVLSDGLTGQTNNPEEWAGETLASVESFRSELESVDFNLSDQAAKSINTIETLAQDIRNDEESLNLAVKWVVGRLPTFIYVSDYPELDGHQNLRGFVTRKNQGSATEADRNFSKLAKVADLDPDALVHLLEQNYEERQLLTNRAGSVVTGKIREMWTDRKLTVRFNLDADHFDTLISDPNSPYAVEVNLNDRSRGFKWFFSFYTTFAADTAGGPAEEAILLLDEPGLHLHALAQRDLLDHFKNDFHNQIIYTTHSPFMVPTEELSSIRTVNIDEDAGTTVTNSPTGDERTLFPLQAALGYDLTQTLFVAEKNLVVEGVSDFWYLSSISDHLNEQKDGSGLLSDLIITPAAGAQKVPYMVALLTSQGLRVLVLMDDEPQTKNTKEELVKSKLIREESVVFTSEAFPVPPLGGADIEDLIDPAVFHRLVEETYAQELAGESLMLNEQIPRVVKRYEVAFKGVGKKFNKTRPAKLFLRRIAENPESVMNDDTRERFRQLFRSINRRLEAQVQRNRAPYS